MNRVKALVWPGVSYVAALAGTGVAAYLVHVHYDDSALICTIGDCATVQKSEYAELWGMPIALLGLGMHLASLALGMLRWRRPAFSGPATVAAFARVLVGALYAAYLTYVELFVIDDVCQWCVASAVLTLVILTAEGVGVWQWLAPAWNGNDLSVTQPRVRFDPLRSFRQTFEP